MMNTERIVALKQPWIAALVPAEQPVESLRQRSDTMQTQAVMSSSSITMESSVKRRRIQFRTALTPVTSSGIVTFSSGTCA